MPQGARRAQRKAPRRGQVVLRRSPGFPPGARDFGDPVLRWPHRAHAESARSLERTRASRLGRIDPAQSWRDRERDAAARDGAARRIQIDGRRMTVEAVANSNYGTTASGSSFYAAMRILPREQREAMFQIYSFCRQVDDIADSHGPREERLAALQKWRDDVDALYRGQPPARLS